MKFVPNSQINATNETDVFYIDYIWKMDVFDSNVYVPQNIKLTDVFLW